LVWFSKTHTLRRYFWIGVLAWSLVMVVSLFPPTGTIPGAEAQQLFLPGSDPLETQQLPPDVRKIGGSEIAPVYFQGDLLFEVASPSVLDRENPGNALPVEVRANRIEADLDYVVSFTNPDLVPDERTYRTVYDPESFNVQVNVLNGQTVITASDDYRHSPQVLATVTETDAEYYGLSQEDLGKLWRDRIQSTLSAALQERSPRALKSWLLMVVALVAGLVALAFGSVVLFRRLSRRKQQLHQQIAAAATPTNEDGTDVVEDTDTYPSSPSNLGPSSEPRAEPPLDLLASLQEHTELDNQVALINFGRWLLIWAQLLVWVVAIAFLIDRYPLGQITAWDVLLIPQLILLVWFMAGLGNRLLNLAISRAVTLWQTATVDSSAEMQRRQLRLSTTVNVLSGLKTVIIYLLAIFFTLNVIGLNTNSLLAFGALLGLAISLAAQNVIKDLVNGFLILVEDQYAIGDVIEIDTDTSGLVENLNLRVTQLRDLEGRLITLPNSQIGRVVNQTRLWARMDESVFVDASTDTRQALAIVQTTADSLYNDPQFKAAILEPPELLGIETMTHAGIEIRTLIKTKPAQQWTVAREFRLRLKTALDEKGIALGRPQREVWHHNAGLE
jgi:small-conductance mechanosensitive channel